MMTLQLRDARDSDVDAIRTLTLSAYQQYAALMPVHWEFYKQNILSTLANVEPAQQIVAEQDGVLVGTVLLYPEGTVFSLPLPVGAAPLTSPEVRLLAVAPEARGQGVGAALMRDCARRARELGSATLCLHTTDMMSVAMRMYEKLGFVRDTHLDFHPAPNITIKGYRLDLTDQPA